MNTEEYINRDITGKIVQVIIENMFRDLGFFVLYFGQEQQVQPITQLENFCKGFKLQKGDKNIEILPLDFIRTLPDFLVVSKEGDVILIEAKFRKNGTLFPKDEDALEVQKQVNIIVANIECDLDRLIKQGYPLNTEEDKKAITDSRFLVYGYDDEKTTNEEEEILVEPLIEWLESIGIDKLKAEPIIKKYEEILLKWLNKLNP